LKLCYNVFILENKIDARVFRRTCVNLCYILLETALICVNLCHFGEGFLLVNILPSISIAINSFITFLSVAVGNVSTTNEEQFKRQNSELDILAHQSSSHNEVVGAGKDSTTHEIVNTGFNLNNKYYL
jgi:hypothetical protein